MISRAPAILLSAALALATARAGDALTDWQEIVALDVGPRGEARNVETARLLAVQHLNAQERTLRAFITAYPQDAHGFEAKLRLSRLLEIRGGFESSEKARVEARQLLEELEKTATPEQRVEVDFAKVTRLMRGAQHAPKERREQILAAARKFHAEHPGDRRAAMLLVEVATLFDQQPKIKAALLNDANIATMDEALKRRIADDLRRLDLLGQLVPLAFTSIQGDAIKLEDFRGKPVLLLFFADFSPPSTEALAKLQRVITDAPKGSVAALGVSLDAKREPLDELIKARGLSWPVAFDGKSWDSPLARTLGINALPTVWLIDKRGKLRSLNALEGAAELIQQLASE